MRPRDDLRTGRRPFVSVFVGTERARHDFPPPREGLAYSVGSVDVDSSKERSGMVASPNRGVFVGRTMQRRHCDGEILESTQLALEVPVSPGANRQMSYHCSTKFSSAFPQLT